MLSDGHSKHDNIKTAHNSQLLTPRWRRPPALQCFLNLRLCIYLEWMHLSFSVLVRPPPLPLQLPCLTSLLNLLFTGRQPQHKAAKQMLCKAPCTARVQRQLRCTPLTSSRSSEKDCAQRGSTGCPASVDSQRRKLQCATGIAGRMPCAACLRMLPRWSSQHWPLLGSQPTLLHLMRVYTTLLPVAV